MTTTKIDMVEHNYKKAISSTDEYKMAVKNANIYQKSFMDAKLEMWISYSLAKQDIKSLIELIKLRRPIQVGILEGAKLIAANPDIHVDLLASMVGKAVNDHANKYWDCQTA